MVYFLKKNKRKKWSCKKRDNYQLYNFRFIWMSKKSEDMGKIFKFESSKRVRNFLKKF